MEAINKQTLKQRARSYLRSPLSLLLLALVTVSALITVSALVFLIVYILVNGIPYLTPDLFAWEYNSENVSLMPALINTIIGEKVSITSKKPQTTRNRVLGVVTNDRAQFVFVDTPGFQTKYGNALIRGMNRSVRSTLGETDAVVLVIESSGWKAADEKVLELINPEIIYTEGEQTGPEGCLSVPGKFGMVTRPYRVRVRAQDRNGNWFEAEGEELMARAFCHELEHLDGHLYVEHIDHFLSEEELMAYYKEQGYDMEEEEN